MKKQSIAEKFKEFQAKEFNPSWIKTPYETNNINAVQKEVLINALILWKFLRKLKVALPEKRAFIKDFLKNNVLSENILIRIVAKIEALPSSVWRKLLWRENIDFSDYEPCLRRLNLEQIKAIEDNYSDLFGAKKPKTPRVFKKSWRDRVKLFFKIINPEKLLSEDYNDASRNKSKGAYAFNLLGLDFGFSLYPEGDKSDHKITNQKWMRFFSIKAHINDFIVNMEDGKYWWLYKTARSNYLIYPNKDVKMKDHVCPGFWLTLIIQTLFWIVSPIAIISAGIITYNYGFVSSVSATLLFAFPMIAWTFLALVKMIFMSFYRLISKNKVLQIIGIGLIGVIVIVLVGIVLYAILSTLGLLIASLSLIVGPILSVMFTLTAIFYVIFGLMFIFYLDDSSRNTYKKIPSFIRFILHLSLGSFVIVILDKFVTMAVVDIIVKVALNTWNWFTSNPLINTWLLANIAFIWLFLYFYSIFINDEKKFASMEKTFTWLTRGFMTLTSIIFSIWLIKEAETGSIDIGNYTMFALAVLLLVIGFSFIMVSTVNRDNIKERILASEFVLGINDQLKGSAYKIIINKIMASAWLQKYQDRKWEIASEIHLLSFKLFYTDPVSRTAFTNLLINRGSEALIKQLSSDSKNINDLGLGDEDKLFLVQLIVKGASFEKALEKVEKRQKAYDRKLKLSKAIFVYIFFPFVMLGRGLILFFKTIQRFILTLKDLWDLFNKHCPFITKSRYLD